MATVKKSPARKKTTRKKTSSAASHRKTATAKKNALIKQLRDDLKATRATLKAARAAARAEAVVLNDELKAALKRERELIKLGEKKVSMMVSAGEKWERKQVARIKKIVSAKRRPKSVTG